MMGGRGPGSGQIFTLHCPESLELQMFMLHRMADSSVLRAMRELELYTVMNH